MRKRVFVLSLLFMFICGSLMLPGCGTEESSSGDGGVAVEEGGEITIGALLPMSGDLADYGQNVQKGVNLAVKQINEAGGPLGKKLKVVFRDCQSEPTALRDGAEKLVNVDKVPAIIGPMIRLDVATPVASANHVVLISPSNTPTWVTTLDDDDYTFRTTASDAIQGQVLGQQAWDCGYKTAAILYINDPYGGGLAESTTVSFEKLGGKVLGTAAYDPGEVAYRMQLNELAKGDPDVLILIAYPESGVVIIREALSAGLFDQFMFPDGMQSTQIIEDVGGDFLEGMYGTGPGAAETPSYATYLDDYQAEYGEKPATAYTENAYDGVVAIALAIAAAGEEAFEADPGMAIRDNLRVVCNPPGEEINAGVEEFKKAFQMIADGTAINYEGAAGSIDFDEYGDTVTPILIWKIENGDIVPVKSVLAEQ
ncbi:MAG TPA: ABC transporter substrate-binding protein [Firmicutes bacterium]|jgi:branched-chain amino acid transport system substrate-binding protein|nr:ABC transporter substrate-binding protein [Bacillota bacterium]